MDNERFQWDDGDVVVEDRPPAPDDNLSRQEVEQLSWYAEFRERLRRFVTGE